MERLVRAGEINYYEHMYRLIVGFSSKTRFKNQYIFVCIMGARAASMAASMVASAFVAGATGAMTAVFDTKQYTHNNPKL
jgi:hypothetical protein